MTAATKGTPKALDRKASTFEQRLAKLADDPKLALAPLLGDGTERSISGRRVLYPYLAMRDLTALLGWAGQLKEVPQSAETSVSTETGQTRIAARGVLLGEQVELVAWTHRPIRSAATGRVAWDSLLAAANVERAAIAEQLDHVALAPWERAAPLLVMSP